MIILKYVNIVFVFTNIKLYLCFSETEDGLDDILNPSSSITKPAEQTQESPFLVPDDGWLVNALQDIAYFLRNHKFNEWDRRSSIQKSKNVSVGFFNAFPDPKLKTVHWKVNENCYKDFYQCIKYLYSVIETAPFTRNDDIVTTLNKNASINKTLITKLNNNCKKALLYTEKSGLPFDAPQEKFQWRTSASYFMCWYTMLGIPELSMLGESCDNYANCLDTTFGHRNYDPRSDDKFPFACAMYSFCPDPCCPLKHVRTVLECYNNENNPCFIENAESGNVIHRECRFYRKYNQNLEDIILNKWNVSCYCREKGFEWKSQFGMCVDIDECTTDKHNCHSLTESCINLPGTFQCICKWGYAYDAIKKYCTKKNVIDDSSSKNTVSSVGFLNNIKCFLAYVGF